MAEMKVLAKVGDRFMLSDGESVPERGDQAAILYLDADNWIIGILGSLVAQLDPDSIEWMRPGEIEPPELSKGVLGEYRACKRQGGQMKVSAKIG